MEYLVRECTICGQQYPAAYTQACEVGCRDSWRFWCQKHRKPAEERGCEDCAYKFGNESQFEPRQLGLAMYSNWPLGKQEIARRKIAQWLLESVGDRVLADRVRGIERETSLTVDDYCSLVVMLL